MISLKQGEAVEAEVPEGVVFPQASFILFLSAKKLNTCIYKIYFKN